MYTAAPMPAVLLVPGWSDRRTVLRPLERHLLAAGWPRTHVRTVGFRDRFGGNIEHAHELADAVDALCADARVGEVAVVAHSMGGLALRWYLARLDGARRVRRAVFMGTPHQGTWLAWLALGRGARDMRPGSVFLRELNASPLPDTVQATCIRSPMDLRIFPPASALLAGATSTVVRSPSHPGMLRSPKVFRVVQAVLEGAG